MIKKAAIGTVVVFVASLTWLLLAYSNGTRTNSWTPVQAEVLGNSVDRSAAGRTRGMTTAVMYRIDGVEYECVVDEYLVGKSAEIYVNPENSAEAVGKRGATLQTMFRPIVVTGATGLFAVVLVLIALSPKED